MTLLLTFKSNNLLSHTLFVLYIHYSGAGSTSWPYPKNMMLSHWLERKTGSLPTAVISENEPRSYNFMVCKSDSLTYHKSLPGFNQVLSDASAPQMKATDEIPCFTTIRVKSLQDKSKNTRLQNFHTSRGNFPFHTFKCSSNGVYEMFSFKIK